MGLLFPGLAVSLLNAWDLELAHWSSCPLVVSMGGSRESPLLQRTVAAGTDPPCLYGVIFVWRRRVGVMVFRYSGWGL